MYRNNRYCRAYLQQTSGISIISEQRCRCRNPINTPNSKHSKRFHSHEFLCLLLIRSYIRSNVRAVLTQDVIFDAHGMKSSRREKTPFGDNIFYCTSFIIDTCTINTYSHNFIQRWRLMIRRDFSVCVMAFYRSRNTLHTLRLLRRGKYRTQLKWNKHSKKYIQLCCRPFPHKMCFLAENNERFPWLNNKLHIGHGDFKKGFNAGHLIRFILVTTFSLSNRTLAHLHTRNNIELCSGWRVVDLQ